MAGKSPRLRARMMAEVFYKEELAKIDTIVVEKDINKIVIFLRNIKEQISSSFEEPKKIKKILELDPRKQKKTAEQEKKKYLDKIDLINNFYEKSRPATNNARSGEEPEEMPEKEDDDIIEIEE